MLLTPLSLHVCMCVFGSSANIRATPTPSCANSPGARVAGAAKPPVEMLLKHGRFSIFSFFFFRFFFCEELRVECCVITVSSVCHHRVWSNYCAGLPKYSRGAWCHLVRARSAECLISFWREPFQAVVCHPQVQDEVKDARH